MGNIQKSLQRYVGFEDIDVDYCNKIENLMDKAQVWAMDVEMWKRSTIKLRFIP